MIIIMKPRTAEADILSLVASLNEQGMRVDRSDGDDCTVIGVVGNVAAIDESSYLLRPGVERVMRVSEPFKLANRKFHPHDSVIDVAGVPVGGKRLTVIAGPCSVESEEQLCGIAEAVKNSGAALLRGGAFKPRTSPYSFQGLKEEGVSLLEKARKRSGLPIVTEIMAERHIELFNETVDLIQVGARNMQNFDLLKELGKIRKPILLKRGLSNTIEEWLMSAEYIMAQGNPNVILCERGIRTFENYTRNTLDLSAIPAVKRLSHLPVIVDPSHATGKNWMVESMALAAIVAGADGLMIEVHNDPQHALCDGAQSLTSEQFAAIMEKARRLAPVVNREL
ncbi:MAG: 3-deoxy-7-phosphoheptulonate synthase [Eubacteriales bacterium]|nr:3-deoxy-7-phosphoheptulonate synthase [Eubacteriales bacterium]MDD3881624.1 3-deoxy-7-phosphoheptulonate synthase [Eubacteriales bacterium]MDD4512317.1 3-deoxy-7-phosphoheptulonate synthase [Eubacteriales bacterium]